MELQTWATGHDGSLAVLELFSSAIIGFPGSKPRQLTRSSWTIPVILVSELRRATAVSFSLEDSRLPAHRLGIMKLSVCLMLIAACVQPVMACDLCAVYAATEAQGGSGTGFFGGVAEQFTRFNTFQVDGREAPNIGDQYINSSLSQAFLGYNFNHRVGVQFNLPVIYRDYGYKTDRGSELGMGDISLIGNFRLYEKLTEKFTFNWTALGGLKFPTGDSGHLNPAEDDFAPGIGGHDLTLGSGSFDGLVGTGFFSRWKRLFLSGAMQYAIRSEGDFNYQFANDWIWSGGPGVYLLLGHEHTLSVQAVVSGETKSQDTIGGVPTDDTAITAVYLGPQISLTWSSKLSAQVGADLPVSIATTGQQVVPDYRVRAVVMWRF